ncbi:helix-turn-helix domain-containing protein [Cohnella sp. GCM10020058]|uniref:helix-turn-helix domain-containing protein n=1 Tax=Cohnella sp. GCM10020058 TaxID=3317330 RepID=UPI00363B9132
MALIGGNVPFKSYPNSKAEAYLYGAHVASVPADWRCARHLHHRMLEINFVLEGMQGGDVGGSRITQSAGELLVVPPMLLHTFRAETAMRYFVFHVQIDDPVFMRRIGEAGVMLLGQDRAVTPKLIETVSDIRERFERGDSKPGTYRLVYALLEMLEDEANARIGANASEPDALPLLIAREIESIVSRPEAEASDEDSVFQDNWMEAIADRLGYSRRHCYRAFSEAYRMSPRQYLFVLRQQEAMHLLANTRLSLEEIARRIGYDNAQSFIRQFSKWTGMTPGRFRKEKSEELSYLTPIELA